MSNLPTSNQVATLLRARTKDSNGLEAGVFNGDTRPTDTQVDDIVLHAADEVYAEVGAFDSIQTVPLQNAAIRLVALKAAMLIELSFFPEQTTGDRSAFDNMRELYEANLPRLVKAINEAVARGDSVAQDGVMPYFSMPEDCGGMVGWGTVW